MKTFGAFWCHKFLNGNYILFSNNSDLKIITDFMFFHKEGDKDENFDEHGDNINPTKSRNVMHFKQFFSFIAYIYQLFKLHKKSLHLYKSSQ